jgi:hypothetical protein
VSDQAIVESVDEVMLPLLQAAAAAMRFELRALTDQAGN